MRPSRARPCTACGRSSRQRSSTAASSSRANFAGSSSRVRDPCLAAPSRNRQSLLCRLAPQRRLPRRGHGQQHGQQPAWPQRVHVRSRSSVAVPPSGPCRCALPIASRSRRSAARACAAEIHRCRRTGPHPRRTANHLASPELLPETPSCPLMPHRPSSRQSCRGGGHVVQKQREHMLSFIDRVRVRAAISARRRSRLNAGHIPRGNPGLTAFPDHPIGSSVRLCRASPRSPPRCACSTGRAS